MSVDPWGEWPSLWCRPREPLAQMARPFSPAPMIAWNDGFVPAPRDRRSFLSGKGAGVQGGHFLAGH